VVKIIYDELITSAKQELTACFADFFLQIQIIGIVRGVVL